MFHDYGIHYLTIQPEFGLTLEPGSIGSGSQILKRNFEEILRKNFRPWIFKTLNRKIFPQMTRTKRVLFYVATKPKMKPKF